MRILLAALLLWPITVEAHHRPQDISVPLASAVDLDDPTGVGSGVVVEILGERLVLTVKHVAIIPDGFPMTARWHLPELVSVDNPFGRDSVGVTLVVVAETSDLAILRPTEELPSHLLPAVLAKSWHSSRVSLSSDLTALYCYNRCCSAVKSIC